MTTKQRAYLRSAATKIDTVFQVGKGGISDKMAATVSDALEAHELVKGRTLDNSDYGPRDAGEELAGMLGAELVCVIGTKFVLYRESTKNKDLSLVVKTIK